MVFNERHSLNIARKYVEQCYHVARPHLRATPACYERRIVTLDGRF